MSAAENKAVFLSYASQDAAAATRIAEALRAAGVEVWFDQNELTGGDAWDAKIRGQIASCALFVPVISASTQARLEGYFRIEWKLAAQRTHAMADEKAFLLPVVIDETRDADAKVPAEFKAVQWTRLVGGEGAAVEKFCARVKALLGGSELESGRPRPGERGEATASPVTLAKAGRRVPAAAWIAACVVALAITGFIALRPASNAGAGTHPPSAEKTAPPSGARQLVQKARELLQTPTRARVELETADRYCKQASALDEMSAELWAVWSLVDAWSVYYNFDSSPQRRESARTKAEKGIQLWPTGFEQRLAQAAYIVLANQHSGALSAFAPKAEQLLRDLRRERPRDPEALLVFALLQRNLERRDAAQAAFRELAEIPSHAAVAFTELGWAEESACNLAAANEAAGRAVAAERYWNSLMLKTEMALNWEGDLALAKATFEQMPASALQEDYGIFEAIQLAWLGKDAAAMLAVVASVPREWLQSNFYEGPTVYFAGQAHVLAGRPEAARQSWSRALQVVERRLVDTPDRPELLIWKTRLQARLGDGAAAQATFRLFQQVATRPVLRGELPQDRAADYWLLGERDAALAHLEECVRRNEATWARLKLAPDLEPMRNEPRFRALLDSTRQNPRLAPGPTPETPPTDQKSVAVLAFANLSSDKEQEYFSDGLSEELLNVLAKVPGLKVSARTSAFYFKGKDTPIPEIAKQLGVAYVIEGSVRKAGDKVRITAQLIKAADGFHVWSETYTRDLKDVFALHDEIAGLVADKLRVALSPGATTPARRTANLAAYELFLEAKFLLNLKSPESIKRSVPLFEAAVAKDPEFALGWAHLAFARNWEMTMGAVTFAESGARAELAARQAVRWGPDLPEAQAALGDAALLAWDWKLATRASETALRLAPNNSDVLQSASWRMLVTGGLNRSAELARRAAEIDPFNFGAYTTLGMALLFSGRLEEAEVVAARMETINPGHYLAGLMRWNLLVQQARWEQALALPEPNTEHGSFARVVALHGHGRREESDAEFARIKQRPGKYGAYDFAMMHAFRGEVDEAFARLEQARKEHNPGLLVVKRDPMLKRLHGDPRWPEFLRALGLADDQL